MSWRDRPTVRCDGWYLDDMNCLVLVCFVVIWWELLPFCVKDYLTLDQKFSILSPWYTHTMLNIPKPSLQVYLCICSFTSKSVMMYYSYSDYFNSPFVFIASYTATGHLSYHLLSWLFPLWTNSYPFTLRVLQHVFFTNDFPIIS